MSGAILRKLFFTKILYTRETDVRSGANANQGEV